MDLRCARHSRTGVLSGMWPGTARDPQLFRPRRRQKTGFGPRRTTAPLRILDDGPDRMDGSHAAKPLVCLGGTRRPRLKDLYGAALYHAEAIGRILARDYLLPEETSLTVMLVLAMCGIATRIYLLSA